MVRLRLVRQGRRHRPFYRLAAMDKRTRRNGRVIESLGWYNPMAPAGKPQLELKVERIKDWLERGAQPTDTVRDILGREGILDGAAKDTWEQDRAVARRRVATKTALSKTEAAATEIAEFAEAAEADVSAQRKQISDAVAAVKAAVATADPDAAESAAQNAAAALADAKKTEEAFQAKKKAEQETASASSEDAEQAGDAES